MPETTELVNPLREGIRLQRTPDPCVMVIFGASGDLTQRKLIPALFYLSRERMLAPGFSVIGCARTPSTDERFRQEMADAVKRFLHLGAESDAFVEVSGRGCTTSPTISATRKPTNNSRRPWIASTRSGAPPAIGSFTFPRRPVFSPSSSSIWAHRD